MVKKRIRLIKIVLLGSAIAMLLALFWFAGPNPNMVAPVDKLTKKSTQNPKTKPSSNPNLDELVKQTETVLTQPRFTGMSDNGRRWEVTAERARQGQGSDTEGSRAVLEDIVAIVEDMDADEQLQRTVKITSPEGVFSQENEQANLRGGVRFESRGYTLETPVFNYNLKGRRGDIPTPFEVHGPLGTLKAGQGRIEDNGSRLYLSQGVDVRIENLRPDLENTPKTPQENVQQNTQQNLEQDN